VKNTYGRSSMRPGVSSRACSKMPLIPNELRTWVILLGDLCAKVLEATR
jgi:hypothetical protein